MIKKILFLYIFLILSQSCVAIDKRLAIKEKLEDVMLFPPYPDVWEYKAGDYERNPSSLLRAPSGDIAIVTNFLEAHQDEKFPSIIATRNFFSGKKNPNMEEEDLKKFNFSWFKGYETVKNGVLLDNKKVLFVKADSGGTRCPNALRYYFVVKDKAGKALERFRIIYLPEKIREVGYSFCEGGGGFKIKVRAFYPTLMPLEDGTFLMYSRDEPYVFRFKSDLTTKSQFFAKNFLVIDDAQDPVDYYGVKKLITNKQKQEIYYNYFLEKKGR